MSSVMTPFPTTLEGHKKEDGFKQDLNNILMCPECKEYPPNIIEEFSSGDLVCGSCGLVVGDRIVDTRSEWRTFSNDDGAGDDPNRVGEGPNHLIDGDQLQTTIAFEGGRNSKNLSHLQNKITQDKASKILLEAYKNIQNFVDRMNAGSAVGNAAKHIYKLVEDNRVLKGKSQEAIIAGCIFIACRQSGVARTFRELHSETKVSKKEIGRVFKQLEAFLQKIGGEETVVKASYMAPQTYVATGATGAVELCTRYCSRLDFRHRMAVENLARDLADAARSISDLAGRSPLSVAAACIYMAALLRDEPRQSKRISQVAGVSDGTVKTAYRFLLAAKDTVIKPEWNVDLNKLPSN